MSVLAFKKAMRCMILNLTNLDRKSINWTLSIFLSSIRGMMEMI